MLSGPNNVSTVFNISHRDKKILRVEKYLTGFFLESAMKSGHITSILTSTLSRATKKTFFQKAFSIKIVTRTIDQCPKFCIHKGYKLPGVPFLK